MSFVFYSPMQAQLVQPAKSAVSPFLEMGAHEALWAKSNATAVRIAEKFRAAPSTVPSDFVTKEVAESFAKQVLQIFSRCNVGRFGIRLHGAGGYPTRLRAADHPVELLYFQGYWDLVDMRSVSIVGSRKATDEGRQSAARIARMLVKASFAIVSGLAEGIDTSAHRAAIEDGGWTIGVIGTPLSKVFPQHNEELQRRIGRDHLLVSQVPVVRYAHQRDPRKNRHFFPERNVTMAALSEATIIVEASDTSGTLTQARAALKQGKKLFIMERCFQRPDLKWPHSYVERGAIRVSKHEDILRHLE